MKRIAVCMPCGDLMHVDCHASLVALYDQALRTRRGDIAISGISEKQTLLDISRHRLVFKAMQMKADYIMWIDSDMQFTPDCVFRLIDAGKDIIGCQALMRAHPFASNTYDAAHVQVRYPNEIVEVKYIGTGFLLTKVEVFEKIGKPYFKCTYNEGREVEWQGEDLNFCDRAREAGYKIYCHGPASKNLFHLGVKPYGYDKETEEKIKPVIDAQRAEKANAV